MELPPLEIRIPWVPEEHQPLAMAVVFGVIALSFLARWMNALAARFQRCPACARSYVRSAPVCPGCGAANALNQVENPGV